MTAAHQALIAAMASDAPVVVDLSEVAEADLTLIQLIESARRTAAEAGRELSLAGPAEGAVLEVLRRGGFLHPADSERLTFWLQGTVQ